METMVKEQAQLGGCMSGFFNIFDRPHLKQQSVYSNLPLTVPFMVESKQSSSRSTWKEAPRLSLDSRAVVDAKVQIRRADGSGSPSVIARLMGLEPLPPLQRSASESRVSRDFRFVDTTTTSITTSTTTTATRGPKSFFDSVDFFPEPRRPTTMSDLETLEQLLQALRLKGLLHSSNKPQSGTGNRNLVFDLDNHQSPIKPSFGIRSGAGVSPSRRDRASPNRRRPTPQRQLIPIVEEVKPFNKLLHSIAEMAAGESQPSPVSVLDASLYHDESSPSPLMKRSLDFTESSSSLDSEYAYISDILRASDCLPQESDIFSLLERQQCLKGKCAAQERRLIFDAVQEIVGRRRRLPPWRMEMQVIWSEFQKIRKKRSATEQEEEDLVGYVCGVLGRDLSEDEDHRWRDCQVEMSEAVLDIERLLFKDLIAETIRLLTRCCVGGGGGCCSSECAFVATLNGNADSSSLHILVYNHTQC